MRMLKIGLWLLLITTFALSQPSSCQPENCLVGILEPGGVFEGIDGIVVDATKAQLDESLTIYIERIEDTSDLLELSQNPNSPLKAETAYYKLGATERYRSKGVLLVYVPLPEGAPTENLAVFALSSTEGSPEGIPTPDSHGETGGISIGWASFPVTYIPERNAVMLDPGLLDLEGSIFTIVAGRYSK
jgi:hypothetical protein